MDPLKESLERKIEPILNPDGPNKEATDELIEALSEVANSKSFAKDYAKNLIEAIKKGYEIQTGEKYE